jgi:fermentation-respiration switch protein FrsA (DUF1100 family)
MDTMKKKSKIWLCVAIALMLVSMIAASAIQSDGGKVTIKTLTIETDDGYALSANLYIPSNATPENKAPAIVASHGAYNNKEMQDANFVELSRRGFVVLSVDQAGQGVSDITGTNGLSIPRSNGVYDGVIILSRLPYVDTSKIGVTGHSMGGMSCNTAVTNDNAAETQLISAVLLNCADATYTVAAGDSSSAEAVSNFTNVYGTRDVGIVSAKYDEFFHKTTDADGNQLFAPAFMGTSNAQSFLYFGTDPEGLEPRVADTMYHETIDGEDVIRVIYRPAIIHPWSHFSTWSTYDTIDFFEEALGAPHPLAPSNQVWTWKEFFNFVGLIGFAMFITTFALLMLFTPFFSSLRAKEPVPALQANTQGKLWFWGSLSAGALFAMITYLPILNKTARVAYVRQSEPYAIAAWAAACGAFTLVVMALFYFLHAKKRGVTLEARGIRISWPNLGKTVLLAIIVASVSYTWVFFADFFFKTDFRIWTLAFKTFNPELLFVSLFPYLPLLIVFFVTSSMATNCFNYNQVGKRPWVNTLIVALFAAAPAVIMLAIQYGTYFTTDHMAWSEAMYVLWMFPLVLVLPAATVISRKIYKYTANPYIAGLINAMIVVLFACMNTRTAG